MSEQLKLEKILTDNNRVSIFEKIYQDEKNLLTLFIIIFIGVFILINGLIFSIYFLSLHSDLLVLQQIKPECLKHLIFNYYYSCHPFLIALEHENHYYNFTTLFILFLIINILYLFFGALLYRKLLNYIKDIKEKIQIIHEIQLKNEKDLLSARIVEKIAEHINHEIKPSLLSLKNIIKEYENILSIVIKLARPQGKREIDKLVYPDKDPKKCLHCSIFNRDSQLCQYYSWYGKNLLDLLKEFKQISQTSINQIFETLNIAKNLKSLKRKTYDVPVYNVLEQSIQIFYLMRKYKFDYKINPKFKECFLNGLSPEILSNIIMNHVKNSLEANATFIEIDFKGYIFKDNKKYIYFELIDNGDGIPQEILDKIYDLDFSTKKKFKQGNSGVGLYLSKQLLKYYGGDEKVKITSPDGTIFCIRIPVKYCNLSTTENCVCCKELEGE